MPSPSVRVLFVLLVTSCIALIRCLRLPLVPSVPPSVIIKLSNLCQQCHFYHVLRSNSANFNRFRPNCCSVTHSYKYLTHIAIRRLVTLAPRGACESSASGSVCLSVCLSDRACNSKTIAPIDLITYTRRSMLWLGPPLR